MRLVPFTYAAPDANSLPIWNEGISSHIPCAIEWRPDIGCSHEQFQHKRSLMSPPGIPWDDVLIGEIRVQSRKAFEILQRIIPAPQSVLVRINPPTLPPRLAFCKQRKTVIFTRGEEKEQHFAASLGVEGPLCTGIDVPLMSTAETVIFCFMSNAYLEPLAAAIANGCNILSSDANAAEEYLARFALPGSWHVAHTWDLKLWKALLRDLEGKSAQVPQTTYIDTTPYIEAWKK